jgi:hypothetical protein
LVRGEEREEEGGGPGLFGVTGEGEVPTMESVRTGFLWRDSQDPAWMDAAVCSVGALVSHALPDTWAPCWSPWGPGRRRHRSGP